MVEGVRKRILGTLNCPELGGLTGGTLLMRDSAVMLQQTMVSTIHNVIPEICGSCLTSKPTVDGSQWPT